MSAIQVNDYVKEKLDYSINYDGTLHFHLEIKTNSDLSFIVCINKFQIDKMFKC